MATYNYKCPQCGHDYSERRMSSEPQFFTNCNICNTEYEEVTNV